MNNGLLAMTVVLLTASVVLVPLAIRLGLGSVMGYLAAGAIVGPWVLGHVTNVEDIMHFSEFGVVMFLFLIGLELNPRKLWDLRLNIFGLGTLQVLLVTFCLAAVFKFINLSWFEALLVGLGFSLSSTAIALQIVRERNLFLTAVGQGIFGILLFQDLAVIPVLAILPLLAVSDSETSMNLWGFLKVIGSLVAVTVAIRYLLRHVLRIVAATHMREVFTGLGLLLVLAMSFLMYKLDLSMGLGAFLAGVLLADSEYRHALESDLEPFKGLLLGLFFMSVGMSIDFGFIKAQPIWILGVLFGVLILKFALHYGLASLFKIPTPQRTFFSLSISQVGEFAFVLFGLAQGLKLLKPETASGVMAVVALSMLSTPVFLSLHDMLEKRRELQKAKPEADKIENESSPVIIAGFGRFGQIVGRFLYANKIGATVLDHDPDQIELVRRFGFKVYYGDATRIELLESAGAKQAKIIVIAIDDVEDSLEAVDMVKEHFPNLKIYARARNTQHYYELMDRGVHLIEREMFEGSLRLGTAVLRGLGADGYSAVKSANRFRDHNIELLRDLYDRRGNEKDMVSRAKQSRDDLEKMLSEEQAQREGAQEGWHEIST